MMGIRGLITLTWTALVAAQFPPKPEGVTVLKSKFNENVTISYKEPGICETTEGVKSYAGYVHLPPGFLDDELGETQDYPINTFFWFFEARNNPHTAPLAIWLNGGPGGSSLIGALMENGPCIITSDSRNTTLNPFSWNNEVNILYIDEPNQVGLSYDVPTNCTLRLSQDEPDPGIDGPDDAWHLGYAPADFSEGVPETNATFRVGTCPSMDRNATTNTTAQAAHAFWHFIQTFIGEFPHYEPEQGKISLWAESYGGHYGPGFMRFFQQQNERIDDGTIDEPSAKRLTLDTLGIVNGYVDTVVQEPEYHEFGYKNGYGVQVYNESIYNELVQNYTKPDGCASQFAACQALVSDSSVMHTTSLCSDIISPWCGGPGPALYYATKPVGYYDVTHPAADPFPPPRLLGYLSEPSVLKALGAPVNFTYISPAVSSNFDLASDLFVGGLREAMAELLDGGVKVHMMYGDRDYSCNWFGGESISLAVPWSRSEDFANAGYAPFLEAETARIAGYSRQLGNYSFTRVFQAGHMVPAYQPAASYDLFMRATSGKDMPTGLLPVFDDYVTVGPANIRGVLNKMPEVPEPRCYILSPETCEKDVWEKVEQGKATIRDYYVVAVEEDYMSDL